MSAVSSTRERRATAGKRMSALVGQALDDDAAFWNHDTWADEHDASGNESFRESDEDSTARVDAFDSDFDDSESDHEQQEQAAGAEEERELQKTERGNKKRKLFGAGQYADIAKAGRDRMPKKKKVGNRVVGDGVNAGIVLNVPNALPRGPAQYFGAGVSKPIPPTTISSLQAKQSAVLGIRPRRAGRPSSRFRTSRGDSTPSMTINGKPDGSKKRQPKHNFTQEELLLEAALETEPENHRWLLSRQRIQDQHDRDAGPNDRSHRRGGRVIESYVSRRGAPNTITFPEMDYVPEILTQSSSAMLERLRIPTFCVVTGERAKYKDPLTGLGYSNAAAFKELRRRHASGELKPQPSKSKTKKTLSKAISTKANVGKVAKPIPCGDGVSTGASNASSEHGQNGEGYVPAKPADSRNTSIEIASKLKRAATVTLYGTSPISSELDTAEREQPEEPHLSTTPPTDKSLQFSDDSKTPSLPASMAPRTSTKLLTKGGDADASTEIREPLKSPKIVSFHDLSASKSSAFASQNHTISTAINSPTRSATSPPSAPHTTSSARGSPDISGHRRASPRRRKPSSKLLETEYTPLAIPNSSSGEEVDKSSIPFETNAL